MAWARQWERLGATPRKSKAEAEVDGIYRRAAKKKKERDHDRQDRDL